MGDFGLGLFGRTGGVNEVANGTAVGIGHLIRIKNVVTANGSDVGRKRLGTAGQFSDNGHDVRALPDHSTTGPEHIYFFKLPKMMFVTFKGSV